MGCAESRNTVQPQGAFSVVTPGTSSTALYPSASTSNRIFNRNKNAPPANKKHKPNALVPEPQGATPSSSAASGPQASLGDLVAATPAPAATPPPEPHGARSMSPSVDAIANAKPLSSPSTQAQVQPASLAKGPSFLLLPTDKQNLTFEELSIQFLKAVKNGDLAYMECVAQQASKAFNQSSTATTSLINIRGMWESTPLIYACQYCHPKAAMWLLEQGANVRIQNEKGVTPLLLASLEGMTDVVDWILKQYAMPPGTTTTASTSTDQQDNTVNSEPVSLGPIVSIDKQVGVVYNLAADLNIRLNPLLAAAMNGHVEIVAKLLAHKASVNCGVPASASVVSSKQFALLLAAKFGHASVVRILIKHGADFATSDANGSHALLLACEASKEECAMELLRLLPAIPSAENHHSLVEASSHSNSYVVAWKQANSHGLTALHFAAANGLVSVVQSMLVRLQWGSDREFLNATSVNRRECALLMACRKRQSEVVQLLIAVGADFELTDRGGTTALQVLKRDKKDELVRLCEGRKIKGATGLKSSDEKSESRRNSDATTPTELAIEVEASVVPPLDGGAAKQQLESATTKSPQAKPAAAFDWDAALETIISPVVVVAPASDVSTSGNGSNNPGTQIARDGSMVVEKPIATGGSSRTMSFAPNAIRTTSGYEQQGPKPALSEVKSANGPLDEDTAQTQPYLERRKAPSTMNGSDLDVTTVKEQPPSKQEQVASGNGPADHVTEPIPALESVTAEPIAITTTADEAQDAEDALALSKATAMIKMKVQRKKENSVKKQKHQREETTTDEDGHVSAETGTGIRSSDIVSRVNSVKSSEECVTPTGTTFVSGSSMVVGDDWDESPSSLVSKVGVTTKHQASSSPLMQQQSEPTEAEPPKPSPPQAAVDGPKEDDAPSPKKERRKKKKHHHASSKRGKQSSMSSLPSLDLQLESSSHDSGSPARPPAPEASAVGVGDEAPLAC